MADKGAVGGEVVFAEIPVDRFQKAGAAVVDVSAALTVLEAVVEHAVGFALTLKGYSGFVVAEMSKLLFAKTRVFSGGPLVPPQGADSAHEGLAGAAPGRDVEVDAFFADEPTDFLAELFRLFMATGRQRERIVWDCGVDPFVHVAGGLAVPDQENSLGFHVTSP